MFASSDHACFVGIDPGSASGGIAILGGTKPGSIEVVPIAGFTERDLLETLYRTTFGAKSENILVVVEQVQAFGQQGAVSSFSFGRSYGSILMAVAALELRTEVVPPQKWQKELGVATQKLKKADRKEHLRRKAQQLYPKLRLWSENLGIQRAVCDALLLAHYGKTRVR